MPDSSLAAALFLAASQGQAPAPLVAQMTFTGAAPQPGRSAGAIRVTPSDKGAVFTVDLHDIAPGLHGFHVHQAGSCADTLGPAGEQVPAGAAGAHWDPAATGAHHGPHGEGHLADLPRIEAGRDGRAVGALVAPRITDLAALKGRAVVVHVGGDSYSDTPEALGGGGKRLACGVLG